MSLVIQSKNFPEHFPKKPHFEFDDEVATIFENMAARSIPNYAAMHHVNAQLMCKHMDSLDTWPYVIVDFGASTGMAMKTLCNQLQIPVHEPPEGVEYVALDNSKPMLDKLKREVPWARTMQVNCARPKDLREAMDHVADSWGRPSTVLMLYFLQFLRPQDQKPVVLRAHEALRHRGLFLFGAKENARDDSKVSEWMNDIYIQHRLDMGYSQKEISAKTKALKGSMHTINRSGIINLLDRAGFSVTYETTRWLQFMSLAATKTRK